MKREKFDTNESKHNVSLNVSKKIVTFIGYFWIVLSVIIAIWQLVAFIFPLPQFQPSNYKGYIICLAVLIGSALLALLLTHFFPSILEIIDSIFDRRQEEEKYFKVSYITEKDNLASTIFESLPYIDDDKFLLNSLKNACFGIESDGVSPDYDNALNIGKVNGTLLYRLGKNYLRVLNGMYSLYALEKKMMKRKNRYIYYKNYFIINDVGWSLTELNEHDYSELKYFLTENIEGKPIYDAIKDVIKIDWEQSAKQNGERLIISAREELKNSSFPKLYAQAIRHCLSFEQCRNIDFKLMEKFEAAIKKIKNKRDRAEMRGNMKFLESILVYRNLANATSDNIDEALNNLEIAQNEYTKINDMSRAVKCYNLNGKLLLARGDEIEAKEKFEEGLQNSKKMQRYDQVLLNLESLTKLEKDPQKVMQYAREGLALAIELKNIKYEEYFNTLVPVKHIFIVRHGESEKNLKKTISGEGALTDVGVTQITERCKEIKKYLKSKGYDTKSIRIYGTHKKQIEESMQIIINSEKITKENTVYEEDLLKPLNMGILSGINEDATENSNESENNKKSKRDALVVLNRWRNGMASAQGLAAIPGIEPFDSYWNRAKCFIDEKIKDDTVSIVVCTTSVAVFLTQYLLNPNMIDSEYKCLDIPLGAVVHFTDIPNKKEYRLMNRDMRTNILYSSIQSNNSIA